MHNVEPGMVEEAVSHFAMVLYPAVKVIVSRDEIKISLQVFFLSVWVLSFYVRC
jgi:hypothetical protein